MPSGGSFYASEGDRLDMSVYIIGEAGVNHNGNLELAHELIDAAKDAGVDAVKFQTFVADSLVTLSAEKAEYQIGLTDSSESQHDMLKRLELTHAEFTTLRNYSEKKGISFLSTAFDNLSLDFLVNELSLQTLKIPSGEITNGPFLLNHALTGRNLIISTGMANMDEIKTALSIVAYGLINKSKSKYPSFKDFNNAFQSDEGQNLLKEKITLLHCTSQYPAPLKDINLLAMKHLEEEFGLPVGYSDHSKGIEVPIAAAAMGAQIIEKHFTLDCSMDGPDHLASLEPDKLKHMVSSIRSIEIALGNNTKNITSSELNNRDIVRKSIFAIQDIKQGEIISEFNIGIKRPGTGLSPNLYWEILGKPATRAFKVGEEIE